MIESSMSKSPADVNRRIMVFAAINIGFAIAVMALKFVAYWVSGSVALYSDALGEDGSGAETYLGMIEYNVKTISKGLRNE